MKPFDGDELIMRMSTSSFAKLSMMSRKDSLVAFASVSPILNLLALAVAISTDFLASLI